MTWPKGLAWATSRPKALALVLAAVTCLVAVILFVPSDQYPLAAILGFGIGTISVLFAWHSSQLARWSRSLQQNLVPLRREGRHISGGLSRLEGYTHAVDLNIGRIAALQANLLEANLETRLIELERGFDRAGQRITEAESQIAWAHVRLGEFDELREAQKQISELQLGLERSVSQPKIGSVEEQYLHALNAMGIMNWGTSVADHFLASGEKRFLELFVERFPGSTIFDVGANVGSYSCLAKKLDPTAIVHSFEPNPEAFKLLEKLAAEKGLTPHQLALSEEVGKVDLFDVASESGSRFASLYREAIETNQPASQITVPCETIDRMVQKLKLKRIDLLKLDVEGHELAILRGASRTLSKGRVEVIQFEFNEMDVFSRTFFRDFIEFLDNYRLFRLLPDGVIKLEKYIPFQHEIFAFQTIVCIHKNQNFEWLYGST